jgi:hypothetical protein
VNVYELAVELLRRFGWPLLISATIVSLTLWFVAHQVAAPCERVSVLWGMVEYTKGAGPCLRAEAR